MAQGKSDSVFDIIFSTIDYCGDMVRNMNSANENRYSASFSPNNIRLLVISPEGCLVALHKRMDKGSVMQKRYSVQKYQSYIMEQNMNPKGYQPLVSVLSHYRQCSNIEEVILLSKSSVPNVTLDGRELDVTNLVKGYHEQERDIATRVGSRYKRLAKFTVLDMTFDMFLSYFRQLSSEYNTHIKLISDLIPDNFKNSLSTDLNTSPFSSSSSYRIEATYLPDKSGDLKNHFESIIEKWKKVHKEEEIKKTIKKEDSPHERNILDMYLKLVDCCDLLAKYINKYPNYFYSVSMQKFPVLSLYASDTVKEVREKRGKTKDGKSYKLDVICNISDSEGSSDDNLGILNRGLYTLTGILTEFLLDNLIALNNPILVKYYIDYEKFRRIYSSKVCESKFAEFSQKYKLEFPTRDSFSANCISNICYNISILVLQGVSNTNELRTLEYWKEKLR